MTGTKNPAALVAQDDGPKLGFTLHSALDSSTADPLLSTAPLALPTPAPVAGRAATTLDNLHRSAIRSGLSHEAAVGRGWSVAVRVGIDGDLFYTLAFYGQLWRAIFGPAHEALAALVDVMLEGSTVPTVRQAPETAATAIRRQAIRDAMTTGDPRAAMWYV